MTDAEVFFAFARGERQGPMPYEALAAMAARGDLSPEDLVWKSGTPAWVEAATLLPFPEAPVERPAPGIREPRRGTLLDDLASFSFAEIVPVSRLVDPEALGRPVAWVLLLFGLGPIALGSLVEDPQLRVRLFNFGCGALWTVFFIAAFKTSRQSIRLGVTAFFATGIFGVLFVSLLQQIPPLSWLYRLLDGNVAFPVRLVAYIGGVGLLEETGKGLILLLLARWLGGIRDTSDGLFYGLMSGLGFGVYEAVAYTEWIQPREATILSWRAGSASFGLFSYFVAAVVRIVSLPLLHAVWTGIVGYFLGLSFAARRKTTAVLILGLALASILHGLYDAFLTAGLSFLALLVAATTFLLFLAYARSADRLLAEVRRADGEIA